MNSNNTRAGAVLLGALWALTAGFPAVADDTELFVSTSAGAGVQPNILFIIDNSGSMDTEVVTQDTYDPNVIWTGACAQDRVYFRTDTGREPNCDTDRWFYRSALVCDAANRAFATGGIYIDKLVQYDYDSVAPDRSGRGGDVGLRWETIDRTQHSRVVECLADAGKHGGGGADLYARDGSSNSSGYWGAVGNQITWTSSHNNQTYTLYTGNYLNWQGSPTRRKTRLAIVQEVAATLINSLNGVNVALMYFNPETNSTVGSQGGLVAHAMEDVAAARSSIISKINALTPGGYTPLSETLYEAALYYRGDNVRFGTNSVPASRVTGNQAAYQSPINDTCQQNYIVMLTDGEPTLDVAANSDIPRMTDFSGKSFADLVTGRTCDVEDNANGQCLDNLAEFLHKGDQSALDDPSTPDDRQFINTYTIGFAVDLPVLAETAKLGGGEYYTADDTASLATALTNILIKILNTNQTFSSPTVAVNAFNRTQNLSDLFISVFSPTGNRHWHGNLKKYRLRPSDGVIIDANGAKAIDPATGFFSENAQSYWSATVDGKVVVEGGAANVMPLHGARKIYTFLGTEPALTHTSNEVSVDNIALTDAHLDISGITGEPTRGDVIRFIRGEDFLDWNDNKSRTDERRQMGDPLHSQPVSAIYGPGQRDGLIFFATNDGVLHALDLESGVEQWAFIPPEFLLDQALLFRNEVSGTKHYGIDGDLRVLMIGDNDNQVEDGEKVFLYFGMGRGGDFYYALDVTDPDAPVLAWKRDGSTLPHLGQTWSAPVPTRIDIQGATYDGRNRDKRVLVISGGYEPDQDLETYSTDTVGNALYIVDAYSGNTLWSASNSGSVSQTFATAGRSMDYSIPGRIRVVDFDGDGFADRFYAGDMGGQVWRFDVTNGNSATSLVAGGVIAQLGAAPNAASAAASLRRFYYTPDVATVNTRTENFIHIGIGSGHRGHPLNTTNQDRFYALRDYNINPLDQNAFNALPVITDAALTPVTTTNTTVASQSPGWRLDLNLGTGWAGEKVLAEARTFNNQVIFSTFRPGTAGAVSCTPQLGTNRVYQMNIFNGAPVTNLDGVVDARGLTMSDLYLQNTGGILSTAQALFVDSDSNNNGIPDAEEDEDDDGIPDSIDTFDDDGDAIDTDRDGIPDAADDDIDGDGIPNAADPDADGNGIADANEDSDGDGIVNSLDPDDDNDGILDIDEEDDTPVICVGLICFPAGFQNTPVRTFWAQESVD